MNIISQQMNQVKELASKRLASVSAEYYELIDKFVADYEKTLRLTIAYEDAIKNANDLSPEEKDIAIAENLKNYDRLNIIYNKLEHTGKHTRGTAETTFDGIMALLEYEVEMYESMKRTNAHCRKAGKEPMFSAIIMNSSRKRIARCEKKLAAMGG